MGGACVVLLSCASPSQAPAPPDLILLTSEHSLASKARMELQSGVLLEALPMSTAIRPSLASLLTGRLPQNHGLRRETDRDLSAATLGDLLHRDGFWVETIGGEQVLPPGEDWGFSYVGPPPRDTPIAIWLHGEEQLDLALQLHLRRPESVLVVTGLAGSGPALWCGPEEHPGSWPVRVGHVDLVATYLAIVGLDEETDGRDLRSATKGTLRPEDPRELQPETKTELLAAIELQLRAGRLQIVSELLDQLEARSGPSTPLDLLRLQLIERREGPVAARVFLRERVDLAMDPTLELERARRNLDQANYQEVIRWSSGLLNQWSDHLLARWYRARARQALGEDFEEDESWLALHAPLFAERLQIEGLLAEGLPVARERWISDGDLGARLLWSAGEWRAATATMDRYVREHPFELQPRLIRSSWALELGEGRTAERLLAPLLRMGLEQQVGSLYQEAVELSRAERQRVEMLRASFRGRR